MNNIDKKLAALQLERVIGYLGRQAKVMSLEHEIGLSSANTNALCAAIVLLSNARVHIWE